MIHSFTDSKINEIKTNDFFQEIDKNQKDWGKETTIRDILNRARSDSKRRKDDSEVKNPNLYESYD